MQCDRGDLQLAAADAHFACAGTDMRVLLQLLLVEVTLEPPRPLRLSRTQRTQIEGVCQVEIGNLIYVPFHP